ncbi:hypothetical protein K2X30_07305 [bacterium]|jgi:hypothetical protein|nr:hypothetical protein [bacterium]
MTTWVIVSWVFVALLTGVNVFVFLKLKKASQQMLNMAFPGAKDMNDAMSKLQSMTKNLGGMNLGAMAGRTPPGVNPAQMKAAMQMLQQMQGGNKKR